MKYLIFFVLSIFSCKSTTNNTLEATKKNEAMVKRSDFIKVANNNNSYNLYYKIDENKHTPVKIFTYYVTNLQTGKVVKPSQQVAAEKIYWKDENTLAIVPYIEMIKENNEVGATPKINEIIINIK